MSFLLFILIFVRSTLSHQDAYVFVPGQVKVTHLVANIECIGIIDNNGQFKPDISYLERMIAIKKSKSAFEPEGSSRKQFLAAKKNNEPVYEFRSEILVPMIIDDVRGLIPEVGGKIIDFKDYKYSPTARRIYNLPGRFVLKSETPEKK